MSYRFPAEFSRQARVMMASSTYQSFRRCWPVNDVKLAMCAELLKSESVLFLVNSTDEADAFRRDLSARGVDLCRLECRVVPHSDHWVRDVGGTFVLDAAGKLNVIQWKFDGYGYNSHMCEADRASFVHDAGLAARVAASLSLPLVPVDLVCEGGNLHVNGQGLVMATERGLLDQNPQKSKKEIEELIHGALGTSKLLWLPEVLASDVHAVKLSPFRFGGNEWVTAMGVNHVDELAVFCSPDTVLLPEITDEELREAQEAQDPTAAISRRALDKALEVLLANNLNVVRVPEPGPIIVELTPQDAMYGVLASFAAHEPNKWRGTALFAEGKPVKHLMAASYMNFLVANDVCLVPRFYKTGRDARLQEKDEKFRATIELLFAPRRVAQIDVDALAVGGGGMHCISQQIPQA
jgi:agmatine deiminase